jgi:hypothetical protein
MATTIFIRLASRVRQHTDPIVLGRQESARSLMDPVPEASRAGGGYAVHDHLALQLADP